MSTPIQDDDLHGYVDGRLEGEKRKDFERRLAQDPGQAARARQWRDDMESLRYALADIPLPAASLALDPAAIRAARAGRARRRLALAASLVLCVGLGMAGGWQARGWQTRGGDASERPAPMSDALTAYKLMVVDGGARLDVTATDMAQLQAWLGRSVGPGARLPDLESAGFRPVGGRLFATEGGVAAMVLYANAEGRTLSYYVRPPESPRRLLPAGQRAEGGLLARYGSLHGLLYAVVGPQASLDEHAVARALDEQT